MIARALILAITVAVLIAMWFEPVAPVRMVQVDYCSVETKAAAQDKDGKWHFFWTPMYRPCTELDRYEWT